MRRREFMTGAVGAAAWPLAARAQQSTLPVIGFLNGVSATGYEHYVEAFLRGLGQEGFVPDRNVKIEYRWAERHFERLPALAAELVSRRVAVIVAGGSSRAALAAKAATSTIPIVFHVGDDPIGIGLVSSYNRPGGNATGTAAMIGELAGKRLSLLRQLVPRAKTFVYVRSAAIAERAFVLSAAREQELNLREVVINSEDQLRDGFAHINDSHADALYVSGGTLFLSRREFVTSLVAEMRIPASYDYRDFVLAGGLFSYGSNPLDFYRQVGIYTGRVLKGDNPNQLPVVQPTKFQLVINLKTAKTLGLTIPEPLLATADEVIE
jgi:putative tryptophan/tyrosine transport system substrate-binding protein